MKTRKVDLNRINDGSFFSPDMLAITEKAVDLAVAVNAEFGERCPDFEPECCVCQAWQTFDRQARTLARGKGWRCI